MSASQEDERRKERTSPKGDGEKEKGNDVCDGCDLGEDESATISAIEGGAQARHWEIIALKTDFEIVFMLKLITFS